MNPYCLRWLHLQKGTSVEHDVRKTITRVAVRLSSELGIRANPYLPALDIDCVDIRLHLEHPRSIWGIDIEISVRSASSPSIYLGAENSYGTLSHWLSKARLRKAPCLLFYYDWTNSKLVVLTPEEIRSFSSGNKKRTINTQSKNDNIEDRLFRLLSHVANARSENIARKRLY